MRQRSIIAQVGNSGTGSALLTLEADEGASAGLSELAGGKEKVRSALNRATRKAGRKVATASDGTFLYVWNVAD